MAICLGINEDINNLFKRYNDLKLHKKPEAFISKFHSDYADFNLNNKKETNKNKSSFSDIKKDNPFDFSGFAPNYSSGVGNPGNNTNLINFGSVNEGGLNNTNNLPNSKVNNSEKKEEVRDIFDILNQLNK